MIKRIGHTLLFSLGLSALSGCNHHFTFLSGSSSLLAPSPVSGPGGQAGPASGNSSGPGGILSPVLAPPPPAKIVDCAQPGMRGASKSGIRRLTKSELVNAVHNLVHWYSQPLEDALGGYSDLVDMTEVTSFDQVYSLEQMQQWAMITDLIASTASNPPAGIDGRGSIGGDCFKLDPITDDCWTTFFKQFGKQVYRHPLEASDVAFLKGTVSGLSSTDAVYRAVTTLLRSPDFLFHLETGVSEDANRVRLSDYEVANRISFALTGTIPDGPLAAAAESGLLKTTAQVEEQARRLLGTDTAKSKLSQFYSDWLQYDRFAAPDYAITSLATNITWGGSELATDTTDYLNDVFFGHPGTFKDLMTRPTVFPRTESLKIAYNTSGYDATGKTAYASPDHPGLATRLGFLSEQGAVSNPIKRGVFVKRRLLCDVLPTPDFSIVAMRLDQLGTLSGFDHSNSEMISIRTSAAVCMTCHSQINPIGFSLEAFDVFGKARSVEAFIDWSDFYSTPQVPYYNNITFEDATLTAARKNQTGHGALHNLPYPVSNVSLAPGEAITVNSPSDLTNALGTSARAATCMSDFVFRHYDRRSENAGDSCAIGEAAAALQKGVPVADVFIRMLANEDIFWRGK